MNYLNKDLYIVISLQVHFVESETELGSQETELGSQETELGSQEPDFYMQ